MRYVAFLRGINVGGRTIKMAELKSYFEEAGYGDVTTILQTGNVILTSTDGLATLKRAIEAGLSARFSYQAHVQIYSVAKLKQIVDGSPFESVDPATHKYVVFFEKGLEQQLIEEASGLDAHTENIEIGDGVIYWRVLKGSTLQSGFAHYLTKARYKNFHTSRNMNTLRKIVD
ncbi:MAG: DUF1697 domain-containing protein [Acidimicrobiales bacterium]